MRTKRGTCTWNRAAVNRCEVYKTTVFLAQNFRSEHFRHVITTRAYNTKRKSIKPSSRYTPPFDRGQNGKWQKIRTIKFIFAGTGGAFALAFLDSPNLYSKSIHFTNAAREMNFSAFISNWLPRFHPVAFESLLLLLFSLTLWCSTAFTVQF